MDVGSDILFPAWQQREIAETFRAARNRPVTHVELGADTSLFRHDTSLLDLKRIRRNFRNLLNSVVIREDVPICPGYSER